MFDKAAAGGKRLLEHVWRSGIVARLRQTRFTKLSRALGEYRHKSRRPCPSPPIRESTERFLFFASIPLKLALRPVALATPLMDHSIGSTLVSNVGSDRPVCWGHTRVSS